jgi:hypothetical protein
MSAVLRVNFADRAERPQDPPCASSSPFPWPPLAVGPFCHTLRFRVSNS